MSIYKVESIIIGTGNIKENAYASRFRSGLDSPASGLGKDGDVYMRVAGVNSDIFFKVSGEWVTLIGRPVSVSIASNETNLPWLSLPMSYFSHIFLSYSMVRGTKVQQGQIEITTDGSEAAMLNYAVNEAGGSGIGVVFDADVSGSNLRALITTDAGDITTLKYTVKGWN